MAESHVAEGKVLLGVTPAGKEIYYVRKENSSLRYIEFGSGGKLPEMFEGAFSSIAAAHQVVQEYLAKVQAKEIVELLDTKKAAK